MIFLPSLSKNFDFQNKKFVGVLGNEKSGKSTFIDFVFGTKILEYLKIDQEQQKGIWTADTGNDFYVLDSGEFETEIEEKAAQSLIFNISDIVIVNIESPVVIFFSKNY